MEEELTSLIAETVLRTQKIVRENLLAQLARATGSTPADSKASSQTAAPNGAHTAAKPVLKAAAPVAKAPIAAKPAAPTVPTAPALTPAQLTARKLQGKYMGGLRGLPPNLQEQVKAVCKEHGIKVAIKYISELHEQANRQ